MVFKDQSTQILGPIKLNNSKSHNTILGTKKVRGQGGEGGWGGGEYVARVLKCFSLLQCEAIRRQCKSGCKSAVSNSLRSGHL